MAEDEDEGIIIPPPDIKVVADLAADKVAKVGPGFENRLREKELQNPKFCFLNPHDPYYKYFLNQIKLARENKVEKPKVAPAPVAVAPVQAPPIAPPPLEYLLQYSTVSKQDLDIIKLTAQFIAKLGPQFMNSLAQKEQNNAQFDFLRPSHSLYALLMRLVDVYAKVLNMPPKLILKLKSDSMDRNKILERISKRVEFEAFVMNEKQIQYQKEQDEKIAFSTVDWHDFVVVETIEFTEADDRAVLPVPLVLSELQSMTLEERKKLLNFEKPKFEVEEEEDMEIDQDMELDEEPEEEPTPAVQPAKPTPGQNLPEVEQICPRCNKSIKISEMQEHIKMELRDPQYRNQMLKAQAKEKPTNLVDDDALAANLQKMAQFRSDYFGSGGVTLTSQLQFENEKAKEIRKDKVIWDGRKGSVPAAINKAMAIAAKPPPPPGKPSAPKPPPPPTGETVTKKPKLDNSLSLTINAPNGPIIYTDLTPLWTVSALKDRLAQSCGIPAGKQKLSKADYVLKNKETLLEAGVPDGCILTLELKQRGGKK